MYRTSANQNGSTYYVLRIVARQLQLTRIANFWRLYSDIGDNNSTHALSFWVKCPQVSSGCLQGAFRVSASVFKVPSGCLQALIAG